MNRQEQERRLQMYSTLCDGCAQDWPMGTGFQQFLHDEPPGFGSDSGVPGVTPCKAIAVRRLHERHDREDAEAQP